MLTSCASNIVGTAFPYGLGYALTPGESFFTFHNFRQGLSYNPRNSLTAVRDLSTYAVTNTVAYNIAATDYYPNRYGGMVHLNNTTGYKPGTGCYILGGGNYSATYGTTEFTIIISWEYVASNTTYGADIIMGAYAGSSHDYWIGTSGYGVTPYWFSRNGSGVSSGQPPAADPIGLERALKNCSRAREGVGGDSSKLRRPPSHDGGYDIFQIALTALSLWSAPASP